MKKIGVVSDTHSKPLPLQMLDNFKGVDLILHAGDICSPDILEDLKEIKEVKAVYGNMDEHEIRQLFPKRQIIKYGSFSIGLYHGGGHPEGLLAMVKKELRNEKVDAVVFGHSHQPFNQEIDGVLYFNPGSPTDTVFAPYPSYGILELGDKIIGKIVKVRP